MEQSPVRVAQIMGIMNNGGVEAVVMNYYRAIDKSRVQFDFFVDETCSFPQCAQIEHLGGRCFLVPPYTRPIRLIRTLTRIFRENNYQIVHSQINTLGVFPLFAAWLARVPVRICHNHSTSHPSEGKRNLFKHLLRPFSRVFATHCFACGDTAARWMFGDRLVDRGCVTLMPNAVDLARFRYSAEARDAIRAEICAGEHTRVVGHIGRFTFQKNHAFLLEIFRALLETHPDALLLLAGEGELLEQTKAQANSLGIGQKVRFLGVRGDTNRLYSAMDVFCLPSFYEGLPVVMVEALGNGLSCVVSDQVTRELDAFPVTHLPLNAAAARWAEALSSADRTDHAPEVLLHQFDVNLVAKRLEAFYLEQVLP
jgi:glycosyltransferase EpsF